MKAWSTAAFPISVLTTLAGLSFWLLHATSIEEPKRDGKDRHDPDYVITGMKLNKLDKAGLLQYTLTANEVVHFPDDDSTEVAAPYLVYLGKNKPPLTMRSRTAHVSSEGETVIMRDDVHIVRAAAANRPETHGRMPDLTIQTEEETAETKGPVVFTQGNSWLKGVGMNLDNRTQTYVLQSQALGFFESRRAPGAKPAAAPRVTAAPQATATPSATPAPAKKATPTPPRKVEKKTRPTQPKKTKASK